MKRLIPLALLILPISPALAQTSLQPTPSQTAIQIDNVVNQWAQTIETQQKIITDLQEQLTKAQDHIKELEAKGTPK